MLAKMYLSLAALSMGACQTGDSSAPTDVAPAVTAPVTEPAPAASPEGVLFPESGASSAPGAKPQDDSVAQPTGVDAQAQQKPEPSAKMLSKVEALEAVQTCDTAKLPAQVPLMRVDSELIMAAIKSGCGELFTSYQPEGGTQVFTVGAAETTVLVDRCSAFLKGEIAAMRKQVEALHVDTVTDERGLKISNGMGICEGLARLACGADNVPSMCKKSDRIHAMINQVVAVFARRDRVLSACGTYFTLKRLEPDLAAMQTSAANHADEDAVHATALEVAEHKRLLKEDTEAFQSDFGRKLDFKKCPLSADQSRVAH